jgi:hypothetical protein
MKKRGKKLVCEDYDQFTVSYGTVDYTVNKSIYIDITSWVEPLDVDNPKGVISSMDKLIRKTVFNNIDGTIFDPKKYITDLDLRESGIALGKRSFMSCNITLYLIEGLSHLGTDVNDMTDVVIEALKTKFGRVLLFNKRKKE